MVWIKEWGISILLDRWIKECKCNWVLIWVTMEIHQLWDLRWIANYKCIYPLWNWIGLLQLYRTHLEWWIQVWAYRGITQVEWWGMIKVVMQCYNLINSISSSTIHRCITTHSRWCRCRRCHHRWEWDLSTSTGGISSTKQFNDLLKDIHNTSYLSI